MNARRERISHAEFGHRLSVIFLSEGGSYEPRLEQVHCSIKHSRNKVEKLDKYSTNNVGFVKIRFFRLLLRVIL